MSDWLDPSWQKMIGGLFGLALALSVPVERWWRKRKQLIAEELKGQKELEEQKDKTRREHEEAVKTHLLLLSDSVKGLSAEVRHAREVQVAQTKDITQLELTVNSLKETVFALSGHLRDWIRSEVNSNGQRTIVKARKG